MTPEQKAKELVDRFYKSKPIKGSYVSINFDHAKQCALIHINEILEELIFIREHLIEWNKIPNKMHTEKIKFYQEVKNQIQLL